MNIIFIKLQSNKSWYQIMAAYQILPVIARKKSLFCFSKKTVTRKLLGNYSRFPSQYRSLCLFLSYIRLFRRLPFSPYYYISCIHQFLSLHTWKCIIRMTHDDDKCNKYTIKYRIALDLIFYSDQGHISLYLNRLNNQFIPTQFMT